MFGSVNQNRQDRAETRVTRVAADLYCCAKQTGGAELFEDIGVSKQRRFHRGWLILRLMMLNGFRHTVQFFSGESPSGQEFPAAIFCIMNLVPPRKLRRIFWPMA